MSQHGASFEQYSGFLSIENGDHDGSQLVDNDDFMDWQRGNFAKPLSGFDLNAWVLTRGRLHGGGSGWFRA